jgi:hypothetical protein
VQAAIDDVDDRLLVDRGIERLADGLVLQHRVLAVRHQDLERGARDLHDLAAGQLDRLGVEIRGDAGADDQIDLAGAELRIERGLVRHVFQDGRSRLGPLP